MGGGNAPQKKKEKGKKARGGAKKRRGKSDQADSTLEKQRELHTTSPQRSPKRGWLGKVSPGRKHIHD